MSRAGEGLEAGRAAPFQNRGAVACVERSSDPLSLYVSADSASGDGLE